MAQLFAAIPEAGLQWLETIWQGEPVPVIVGEEHRRLQTRRWGLRADDFVPMLHPKRRGLIYPRDLWPRGTRLADLPALERCLIVIEAFAYPHSVKGASARAWVGLENAPLAAWAGLCGEDGCAGLLVRAPDVLAPLTQTMPRLLSPEDCGRWLTGAPLLSLDPFFDEDQFYVEQLGELWSSGRLADDRQLRFAA